MSSDMQGISTRRPAGEPLSKVFGMSWVRFDGTTSPPTIKGSQNVLNVASAGTGLYDVTFADSMENINFMAFGNTSLVGTATSLKLAGINSAPTIKVARIESYSTSAAVNCTDINVIFIGGIIPTEMKGFEEYPKYARVNGLASAWGKVPAAGGLSYGHNVASVSTPDGSSAYTITFQKPMDNQNFIVDGGGSTANNNEVCGWEANVARTNKTVNLLTAVAGSSSNQDFEFVVWGGKNSGGDMGGFPDKFGLEDSYNRNIPVAMGVFNVSSGSAVLLNSYNILSMTTNGTGVWTVNFKVRRPNANYVVVAISDSNGLDTCRINDSGAARTVDSFQLAAYNQVGSNVNPTYAGFVVFGD